MDPLLPDTPLPANVYEGQLNEANSRAFYQYWYDMLNSRSWNEVPNRNVGKQEAE